MKPSTRPSLPDRPTTLPTRPTTRPSVPPRPGVDRPTTLPSFPDRPTAERPTNRPNLPNRPGGGADRPTTLPSFPDRPVADRPVTLPGTIPNRPGGNWPGGNRPGGGGNIPDPPGRPPRPPRPEWPDRWQNNDNRFTQVTNQWNNTNIKVVNNFNVNRRNRWSDVNRRWTERGWYRNWGTRDYRSWRRDVWGYRGDRCRELWYRTAPLRYHNHFFHAHWWGNCHWHRRPIAYNHSPWWWWRPVAWRSVGAFFGGLLKPAPVVYDPGTTVIYEGDTIYINGQSAGNATEYRQRTIALANPPVAEIPVPTPPELPEGTDPSSYVEDPAQPQGDWLPIGVWALTQQEQGDATMFFQLSIDKDGIVGGAYKNVMTGDEQPIVGRLDFETQRVAWHVGEVASTVYETGLANFENDVASLFVHFGEAQTQTWLLVRLPSPEMPPGTVRLPEVEEP